MKLSMIISSLLMLAPSVIHARNSVENLIRKRLDTTDELQLTPTEKNEFFESFFGRLLVDETSHSFSFSLSFSMETESPTYHPTATTDMPFTVAPSASPTFSLTAVNSVQETVVPTPFSDSSNDETFGPTSSITASPSYMDTVVPSSSPTSVTSNDQSSAPSLMKSGIPSVNPTSNGTSFSLVEDNTSGVQSGSGNEDSPVLSDGIGISSMYIIPAIGVVTGVFIFGVAMKAIDRRNPLQYRNLDGDSLSSFSLQA